MWNETDMKVFWSLWAIFTSFWFLLVFIGWVILKTTKTIFRNKYKGDRNDKN